MNRDIAMKWTAALRSGEYEQTEGALRRKGAGFCCLGVLCDLFHKETGEGKWRDPLTQGMYAFNDEEAEVTAHLPPRVMTWAGIREEYGALRDTRNYGSLASMNDDWQSFDEIADVIEKRWEDL